MAKRTITELKDEANLTGQRQDLLHIATQSPEDAAASRIGRADAKRILRLARALAALCMLWLMREWDPAFLIVGRRVFMQFPARGLLVNDLSDVADIIDCLEQFSRWRDAMLVRAGAIGEEQPEGQQDATYERIEAANETIRDFMEQRAPSGETKHEVFLEWAEAKARMERWELLAADVEGRAVRSYMPPKMMLHPGPQNRDHGHPVLNDPGKEALSIEEHLLVTGADGNRYLLKINTESLSIKVGSTIAFPKGTDTNVRRWQLVE